MTSQFDPTIRHFCALDYETVVRDTSAPVYWRKAICGHTGKHPYHVFVFLKDFVTCNQCLELLPLWEIQESLKE